MHPHPDLTSAGANDWRPLWHPRIHYACGQHIVDDWLNVDGFDVSYPYGVAPPAAERIFRCDLTRQHPFPDNTFDLAYSEDFLEHLDQAEAIVFLSEAYRTLKPGGTFRLSCPELIQTMRLHYLGPYPYAAAVSLCADAYTRWNHRLLWTFDLLADVAAEIGYRDVRQWQYAACSRPELFLDSRPEQAQQNLFAELTK